MSLNAYRTLIVIAEVASFSRAAKRLNMTLSAVSMQMKVLEQDLDIELFDRAVRPPCLTPLGHRITEHARSVIAEQDKLLAQTRKVDGLQGTYRIGFIATASVRRLPEFLAKGAKTAPLATFSVETGLSDTLERRVAKRELDAAVVTRSGPDLPNLTYTTIASENLVFALPQDMRDTSVAACFAKRSFILFTPNSGIGRLVSDHLREKGYAPVSMMILDSVEAIMECVNAGIGFTALPRPDVERYAAAGIDVKPLGAHPVARDIVLVTARGSVADRQASALAALFEQDATAS